MLNEICFQIAFRPVIVRGHISKQYIQQHQQQGKWLLSKMPVYSQQAMMFVLWRQPHFMTMQHKKNRMSPFSFPKYCWWRNREFETKNKSSLHFKNANEFAVSPGNCVTHNSYQLKFQLRFHCIHTKSDRPANWMKRVAKWNHNGRRSAAK